MTCGCAEIRAVGGFLNFPDYERFSRIVIKNDMLEPVAVEGRLADVGGIEESWFRCKSCGCTWRQVEPDPPFQGLWAKVGN